MSIRLLMALFLGAFLSAGEATSITTCTMAGAEVVVVVVPAGWSSAIVLAADRDHFLDKPQRVLINGGYFDGHAQPDALLLDGTTTMGRLRHDSPYSGFVWADAAGLVHIARTADPPIGALWAIESGPILVEQGRSGISGSGPAAPRSIIALMHGRTLVIRTVSITLKDLAAGLVSSGIEMAINLDGGPSSALQAHIDQEKIDRPGIAKVHYFLGFRPRTP